MQYFLRTLIAAASLVLLASCASTGENTEETATQQDTAQQGVAEQPGQEAYSYPYGQAPSGYDAYDTSGGTAGGGPSGQPQALSSQGGVVSNTVSADRIVYFDYDSSDIRAESRPVIEANARALAGNQRTITQLEGHTDERGSREYNIALGERRANSVRQYMIALGVSPQQVRIVSYGEERPAAGGQDEQSYALNRRVEIVY